MKQSKTLLQIWKNPEGLTELVLANEAGNEQRKLMDPGSKIIHTFYANSHFEAMTIYYSFMNWGEYTTVQKEDKLPYKK